MQQEKILPWKNWEVVKLIGRGTYGDVYEIQKREAQYVTRAALKVIHVSLDEQKKRELESEKISLASYLQETQSNIISEIYIMESLKSASHIVAIEDYEIQKEADGWTLFIRMELLKSLVQLRSEKNFTKGEILKLGLDLCEGLQACWKKGVIHRDIKPANIFISEFGEYKLGDFGISKQLEHTMAGSTRAGTESYMAPEVFYGKRYDGTVNIYSLGIVLYQLANKGKLPFVSQDREIVSYSEVIKAKQKRLNGEPLPDPAVGGRALGDILRKACAFDPRDRYQNPQEMYRELKKLQQGYDEAEENEEILMEDIHFFSEADDSSTRLEKKDPEVSKLPKKLILAAGVICIAGIIAVLTWGYLHRDVSREADVDKTLETVTPTTEIKISPTESATPTQAEVLPTETVSEDTGDIEESGDGDWFNDWNYDEEGNKIN